MDIDIELEKIIEKYDLDKYYPQYKTYKAAERCIRELFQDINGKIAIITTDDRNTKRFQYLLQDKDADFYYCSRRQNENDFSNYDTIYNVRCLDGVNWEQYDNVWLVSLNGSTMLKRSLRQRGIQYRFLYDNLALKGIICDREWDNLVCDQMVDWWTYYYGNRPKNDYLIAEIIDLRQEYRFTTYKDVKKMIIKKLFFLSILVRDFILAENCLVEMSEEFLAEKKAWQEIEVLLNNISHLLKRKEQRDIYMIWTDAVPFDDIRDVPYLYKKMSKGILFENIYTVCANTNPTSKAILCGKLPVDEDTYSINQISEENSILLSKLASENYDFCAISGCAAWNVIPWQYRSIKYHKDFQPISSMLWDLWRNIIIRDRPTFYMVHSLTESHSPYLSPNIDDETISIDNLRYKQSCQYLDEQYNYYLEKLSDSSIKIHMTDHGKTEYKNRHHAYFVVEGKNIEPIKVRDMCSYVDFHKIVSQIIKADTIKIKGIARKYVNVQDLDYYYPPYSAQVISSRQGIPYTFFGFHGIETQEAIYLHFTDGREWFVKKGDNNAPEPNLFDSYIYDESKVEWYREIVRQQEQNVPDFSKKLKYSKYIHKVFENAKEKNYRKRDIINQIISQYPDNSIYIRLGGSYGKQIYGILSKENQRKIGGVVDLSPDCICSKYGLPVYSSVEELPDTAKIILPSNENFIERAEKECAACSHNLQVLNLHEKLKEYGIYTKDCVALFQPSQEDYEVDFPFDEIQY